MVEEAQQKVLIYDPERCTGCHYCEIACAVKHYGTPDTNKSHIRVSLEEKRIELEATNCQHCKKAVCEASCPEDAIVKDEEKGWVTINPMKCIGCKSCVFTCPLSCPWFDEDRRVAAKCDFCDGEPVCAEYCSPGAIRVGTRAEALEFNRKRYGEVGKK